MSQHGLPAPARCSAVSLHRSSRQPHAQGITLGLADPAQRRRHARPPTSSGLAGGTWLVPQGPAPSHARMGLRPWGPHSGRCHSPRLLFPNVHGEPPSPFETRGPRPYLGRGPFWDRGRGAHPCPRVSAQHGMGPTQPGSSLAGRPRGQCCLAPLAGGCVAQVRLSWVLCPGLSGDPRKAATEEGRPG